MEDLDEEMKDASEVFGEEPSSVPAQVLLDYLCPSGLIHL